MKTTTQRRSFRRASEEERRSDLISATQECIVQGGIGAVTLRKVAEFADVTPGLVRHYFSDTETLLCAAYKETMSAMTSKAQAELKKCDKGALARLRLFIEVSLQAPIMQRRSYLLWASFTSLINSIPGVAAIHHEVYLDFRKECEQLVREVFVSLDRDINDHQIVSYSIAVNAIIDGLWIEGCLAIDLFEQGTITELGVTSVQALLKLDEL